MDTLNFASKTDVGLIADTRGLNKLRVLGQGSDKEKAQALKTAAEQFEALLMKQVYEGFEKANRTFTEDSPLHSKYSGFFESMLTEQRVDSMMQSRGALSKNSITYLIAKQFAGSLGDEGKRLLETLTKPQGVDMASSSGISLQGSQVANKYSSPLERSNAKAFIGNYKNNDVANLPAIPKSFSEPQEFVDKLMPYAVKAAEEAGMNPLVLLSQAALETGWGVHVPKGNNLFGIKAGKSWDGQKEDFVTHEYVKGEKISTRDSFRTYPDVLESMRDYVNLIQGSDRYRNAAKVSWDPERYFDEIQKAGYATDPHYAAKLKQISRKIAFMAYK